ncbi:hypothetical protein Sjap_022233 [Stephania japonica]|uniref:Uncharacterized protein n=1 Tax=Stephania japonica TaxID=461633 RepID=A0AAP0HU92_9MAGN
MAALKLVMMGVVFVALLGASPSTVEARTHIPSILTTSESLENIDLDSVRVTDSSLDGKAISEDESWCDLGVEMWWEREVLDRGSSWVFGARDDAKTRRTPDMRPQYKQRDGQARGLPVIYSRFRSGIGTPQRGVVVPPWHNRRGGDDLTVVAAEKGGEATRPPLQSP